MSFEVKLSLSLIMTLVTAILWYARNFWLERLPKHWESYWTLILILSRVIVFTIAFGIMNIQPSIDIQRMWEESILKTHQGLIPFRDFDFDFSYNPFFHFMIALAQSPIGLTALMSATELVSVLLFMRLARQALDNRQLKLFAVLYLFSPTALWNPTLGGQEESWILLYYVVALLFINNQTAQRASVVGGMVLFLGLMTTKLVALLPLPLMFGLSQRPGQTIKGFILGAIAFIPMGIFLGPRIISVPLGFSSNTPMPPSIWMIMHYISGGTVPATSFFYNALLLLAVGGSATLLGIGFFRKRVRASVMPDGSHVKHFAAGWVIIWVTFHLLTSYGPTAYLLIWLAPLCFLVASDEHNNRLFLATLILNAVGISQASLYFGPYGGKLYLMSHGLGASLLVLLDLIILISCLFCGLAATKAWLMTVPTKYREKELST